MIAHPPPLKPDPAPGAARHVRFVAYHYYLVTEGGVLIRCNVPVHGQRRCFVVGR